MFRSNRVTIPVVMPALVAGIHGFLRRQARKTWMAGTSPAMTALHVAQHERNML
jgi:hypothetical protein